MLPEWITPTFESLPGCCDGLFEGLWKKQRLRFGRTAPHHDEIDDYCARLVCAAVTCRERLLLVLPDFQPQRPALLFTTALLRCWHDIPPQTPPEHRKVLYFGTTIGIRDQLSQVSIQEFRGNLSEVFQQHDIGRRNQSTLTMHSPNESTGRTLPRVITFYSPADPALILRQQNPQCVAIDLDESVKADWLEPLLEEAVRRQTPVVAWSVNPLSECVAVFRKHGQAIVWPPRPYSATATSLIVREPPSTAETQLHTLVLENDEIEPVTSAFREANRLSAKAAQRASGRFGQDAVCQHWLYLRGLESLFVPYGFHEAEASHFWGLKTFGHLQTGGEHFRKACEQFDTALAAELERVFAVCDRVREIFCKSDPPLWNALCNLCIDEPSGDEARLIVFSGSAKKQLFLLALLAYHNIAESDLREIRTYVFTLDELRRLMRRRNSVECDEEEEPVFFLAPNLNWRPLLVGLPGSHLTPRLLPVLRQTNVDVVIYPHQLGVLKRRADEWNQSVTLDLNSLSILLHRLSGQPAPQVIAPEVSRLRARIRLNDPVGLDAGTARRRVRTHAESLWQPDDPVEAITRLLQVDEDQFDETNLFHESHQNAQADERELWCDEAVELRFQNNSFVTYAADEFINVIISGPSGPEIDERSVRSLRAGDRVVLIHGQQRQSFYELIVSRMHQQSSMTLHLSLIRRWQADIVSAYHRWRGRDLRNLEQLLERMNDRGSTLSSTATLQNWLRGHTLCPQDAEDLRRLAEILEMDFVRQNYQRVANAASRLRGLHRGLANKLNRWLQQQAAGIDSANDGELIDAELGLTFGDLKSSLSIQKVAAVQPVRGPLLRSSLGRLES